MKEQFRKLLHEYKVEVFKLTHDHQTLEDITKETLRFTEETLKNQYHYHFHKLAEANRAEIINMINNYVVEALLPPVVEKMLRRVLVVEKRQQMLVDLVARLLETLSEEPGSQTTKAGR